MAQKFIEIENLSNEEAGEMFAAICLDVIKSNVADMKEMLGIPVSTPVTTKDLVTLIQESNLKVKLTVFYDEKVNSPVIEKKAEEVAKVEETATTETATQKTEKGEDDLPF